MSFISGSWLLCGIAWLNERLVFGLFLLFPLVSLHKVRRILVMLKLSWSSNSKLGGRLLVGLLQSHCWLSGHCWTAAILPGVGKTSRSPRRARAFCEVCGGQISPRILSAKSLAPWLPGTRLYPTRKTKEIL